MNTSMAGCRSRTGANTASGASLSLGQMCSVPGQAGFIPGQTCFGSGLDRSRVSSRLQAAAAALTELSLLREKHRDMVTRALTRDNPGHPAASGQAPRQPGTTRTGVRPGTGRSERTEAEDRLEETLSVLKQQLSRLRKQDVGLQSHLQKLDLQISELRLDVRRASEEQQEVDSRPSSGFYELSDGDSLSNSCTSVYSESLPSSQSSLPHPLSPPPQPEIYRRRSADDSATKPRPQRASGFHLGSTRIRASTTDPSRQRPVSTGDLDWILVQGHSTMDPKFQTDLVSGSGSGVYRYPSPLHAVALQSPVFLQGVSTAPPGPLEGQGPPGSSSDPLQRELHERKTRTLGHMDLISRIQTKSETPGDHNRKSSEDFTCPGLSQYTDLVSTQRRHCMIKSRPQLAPSVQPLQDSAQYPSPPAVQSSSDEAWCLSQMRTKGGTHGQGLKCVDQVPTKSRTLEQVKRISPGLNQRSRSEKTPSELPQFVLAQFVPAGSQKVRVRPADRKIRSLRLRKTRGRRTRETKAKGDQRRPAIGTRKTCSELRPGSGSDSSTCSSGLQPIHIQSNSVPTVPRSNIVHRPHSPARSKDQRRQGDLVKTSWWSREYQAQTLRGTRPILTDLDWHSKSSLLHSLNSSYPPLPPRCESEYLADRLSLIHSTLAASSEGELSNDTTNRYGDLESGCRSESESDSSLSLDNDHEDEEHRGLVWTAPHPEAFACRIKASRALKKKIRRFQPTALKVMTLV